MPSLHVMIVDDSPELLRDLKGSSGWPDYESLQAVVTTAESIEQLRDTIERLADDPVKLPQLIFLDLKFPPGQGDGQAALKWLKAHKNKRIRVIPVVMYSSSTEQVDVKKCYENRVNEYVAKGPDEIAQFWKAVQYWKTTPLLPAQ